MNAIMGSVLVLASAAMIAFSLTQGYVPVSRPIYRVYRYRSPAYFWTLVIGYGLIVTVGVYVLTR